MIVGGYELHLYCSNGPVSPPDERGNRPPCTAPDHFMGEFNGATARDCWRSEPRSGWRVCRFGEGQQLVFCRFCVAAGNMPLTA